MPQSPAPRRLFCFGLGFSATALAHRLLEAGWLVAGTCRTAEKAATLRARGIEAHVFGPGLALDPAALAGTTHLLDSVPPTPEGDGVLAALTPAILALPDLRWAGYLSTTGVYGNRDGGWVDESAPVRPSTERGVARAVAEGQWMALHEAHGLPVHRFRLPGIYGPGRSALDQMRAGTARRVDKKGQVFSRIHIHDLGSALMASMERPNPGAIYNVADDHPCPSPEVVAYAAELLGLEPPPLVPFDQANLSPMAASFYGENKRISNARIKAELGVSLRYPSYREGLADQLAAERDAHRP
ncbi:SDR family oxidoreductase [Nitrospirillum pindoramense]|uniref:Nucleoside-diphosphate-sugar epimerase n=1 Tax=Nitrospirillum amazonense TaxID=28077 RepID=A0A560H6A9_9PROT|nr:SDR family oxidoreductase [Nitrospirillum amazonense]TWB41808.1 nucleoside-diphosphate-sugar epimerase [Nitrospirillum amazonense]